MQVGRNEFASLRTASKRGEQNKFGERSEPRKYEFRERMVVVVVVEEGEGWEGNSRRHCFRCAVPPLGDKPVTNQSRRIFFSRWFIGWQHSNAREIRGTGKYKAKGRVFAFSVKSYWIRLQERLLVVSVLSSLISQNKLSRPLVKRRRPLAPKLKSWDNVLTFRKTFGEIGTFTQSLYHTN